MSRIASHLIVVSILFGGIHFSCTDSAKESEAFTFLEPASTNIQFRNDIAIADTMNILNYIYFFNGGGVGLVDINNDGLDDVFFSGNQVSNRLYLNKGKMVFEDISENAGIMSNRWCTGVSVADINLDGFQDIYVAVSGLADHNRENLLYINQGNNTFKETADTYGLNDNGFSTHSTFLDYDSDGDLDLYVLNHANDRQSLNTPVPRRIDGQAANMDRLYRNNGNNTFTDVSLEAGILIEGYGLGVSAVDINNDGWSDIYVSNDFLSNDVLYMNNRDGTFTNKISESIREQTYNAMGNDVADFNNDGLVDIAVLDMLPPDPVREKTMAGGLNFDKFQLITTMNYEPQYMRNTLQLNRGNLMFDEIGRYAGIHRTDWSWSVLFADLDNDGWKDMYITNGYLKDITNRDFIDYDNQLSMFKSQAEANQGTLARLKDLQGIELSNFAFFNNGDLTFADRTTESGLERPSFSNGAAYGDLDLDGDLDLVVNNINLEAFVIRNDKRKANSYIQIDLQGPDTNPDGLGAKVYVYAEGMCQLLEKQTSRGFMSSVSGNLHFGLGATSTVDSVVVAWDNKTASTLKDPAVNRQHKVRFNNSVNSLVGDTSTLARQVISESPRAFSFLYEPVSDSVNDFKLAPLIPHRMSLDYPVLVSGDVNGDNLEDLLIGGNKNQGAALYLQHDGGSFEKLVLLDPGAVLCDAVFADITGDSLKDIVLLTYKDESASVVKVYVNDDNLSFAVEKEWEKVIVHGASFLRSADYNGDGLVDLFLGGRSSPTSYPYSTPSSLLQNKSNHFDIETNPFDLKGYIRDAVWIDFDHDNDLDLVLVGEWMKITFMENENSRFVDVTEKMGFDESSGWWNTVKAGDFDMDGDVDLICGNLGLNSPFSFDKDHPSRMHQLQIQGARSPLQVMTHFVNGTEVLYPSREDLVRRNTLLGRLFTDHQSYAEADISFIASKAGIDTITSMESIMMHSVLLTNQAGRFSINLLPGELQLAPIYQVVPTSMGIILAGNFDFATNKGESFGSGMANLLKVRKTADGSIDLKIRPLQIYGNIRSLVELNIPNDKPVIVAGLVSEELKIYEF